MINNIESTLTFQRELTLEEIKRIEKSGTDLLGGEKSVYVELSRVNGAKTFKYQLQVVRR